ncbi:MAG: hypothetical protein QOE25_766 [Actinomycetota bacterium]|nr:hypothetical protein [Actinomycetota bacterium]
MWDLEGRLAGPTGLFLPLHRRFQIIDAVYEDRSVTLYVVREKQQRGHLSQLYGRDAGAHTLHSEHDAPAENTLEERHVSCYVAARGVEEIEPRERGEVMPSISVNGSHVGHLVRHPQTRELPVAQRVGYEPGAARRQACFDPAVPVAIRGPVPTRLAMGLAVLADATL